MKEDNLLKFFESIKNLSMSSDEKTVLRNKLLSQMNDTSLDSRKSYSHDVFSGKSFFHTLFKPVFVLPAIFIFVFSAGVSFAANTALPGDLLYPVKVGLNEKAINILRFSASQKAETEAKLIEKRFEEIGKLAVKGKISNESFQIAEAQIQIHSDNLMNYSVALEKSGQIEKALEFQTRLEVSLKAGEEVAKGFNTSPVFQTTVVKKDLTTVSTRRITLEGGLETEKNRNIISVSDRRLKMSLEALKEAELVLSETAKNFTDVSSIEKDLVTIRKEIDRSRNFLEKGYYNEASNLLGRTYEKAKHITLLLRAGIMPEAIYNTDEFQGDGVEREQIENEEIEDISVVEDSNKLGEVKGKFKAGGISNIKFREIKKDHSDDTVNP